ncbi:3D domain-containing protein [Candidatus Uhrbacteria bacterium]|nr:3D domain-containing protein [Candidatus Uhrbacteria bacterium]
MNRIKIILGAFAVSLVSFGSADAQSDATLPTPPKQPDSWNDVPLSPVGIWFGLDMVGLTIEDLFEDKQEDHQIVLDASDKDIQDTQATPEVEVVQKKALETKPAKKQAVQKEKKLSAPKTSQQRVTVTAYSSTVDQTDSTPCITANGFNVCEHNKENIIAANFLPFGTRVRLPDLYGDKVFTVQDRMNRRYSRRVDIWMKTREKAKKFGVQYTMIEIVPEQVALAE